jgi:DNA-binding NarL/FixJ family response regulator
MPQRQRILVADGSRYLGNLIWHRLVSEPGLEIVGLACDTEEAVQMAFTLSPDIILVNLSHSGLFGLPTIRTLHTDYPDIPIVAVTSFLSREYTQAALDAGAAVCLTKSGRDESLLQTLWSFTPARSPILQQLLNYGPMYSTYS